MEEKKNSKINIDIIIPIYLHNNEKIVIEITKKIFNHCRNLKYYFAYKANITFTLIGSESSLSYELCKEYFPSDRYFEYFQPSNFYGNDYWNHITTLLTEKYRYGFEKSIEINPDITLLMGSNDYISYNFFEQIIEFYKPDEKQIYGVDKYKNGENCLLVYDYKNDNINDNINGEFHNDSYFWWSGVQYNWGREKFNYTAGIIGFNKYLFQTHKENIIEAISADEGKIEENLLKFGDIKKFNSKKVININIKSLKDVVSFNTLVSHIKKSKKNFGDYRDNIKSRFQKEKYLFDNQIIYEKKNLSLFKNLLDKEEAVKKHNIIHIDICIPLYLYNDPDRINITKKIFNHCNNLKKFFAYKANITFTLIGSEKSLSQELCMKYFPSDRYFEYDQGECKVGYNKLFLDMITNKFRYSFKKSIEINPDITLLMGSNDYISYNFFEQIIDFYKSDEEQIYGIDKYTNGKNGILICCNENTDDNNTKNVWWNGNQQKSNRARFHYTAGIIGFNKYLYLEHNKILLDLINYDEGLIEENLLNLEKVNKFNSKKVLNMNIKTDGKKKIQTEITPYEFLVDSISKSKINYNDIDDDVKTRYNKEKFILHSEIQYNENNIHYFENLV